jgi:hypothetical protein
MEDTALKYNCDKCDFHSKHCSSWHVHLKSDLHKIGKRKTRSDKKPPTKCSECDYQTRGTTALKQHTLNEHKTKEERKEGFKYYCEYCDYGTFAKSFHAAHLKTKKHSNFMKFVK